jgi:Zn-dependent peptidase ImmA (M78 family)/DNA-binding XRE family transcriptional regulator
MKVGTLGFVGTRLTEGRQARGFSGTTLAELIDVTPQSVSQYEHGRQSPSPEMLSRIADKLNLPVSYFLRPGQPIEPNPIFWRGKTTATRAARDRAEIRLVWMHRLIDYLTDFFDMPALDLPGIDLPKDFREFDTQVIERAASQVRDHWRIAPGPMPDLLLEMENNGIIVSRILMGAEKLDAFTQWSGTFRVPFVMLGRDKASASRQRFDAAHEMAHLILHQKVDPKRLNSLADYKIMEDQAHAFAGALLLPADEFSNDLWSPTLDGMLGLKERWKVSVGAMIKRCEALGIIGDDGARRLWINYNRRGWRGETGEPFDVKMEKERPRVLRRSISTLLSEGEQSVSQILEALSLAPRDVEEICDLDPGTLTGETADTRAMPVLKSRLAPQDNIVSLFGKKN